MNRVASFLQLRQNRANISNVFQAQAYAPIKAMRGNVTPATFTRCSGSALLLCLAMLPALFSLTPAQREKMRMHTEQSETSRVVLVAKASALRSTDKDVITTGAIAKNTVEIVSHSPLKTALLALSHHQTTPLSARPQSWVEHIMNDVRVTDGRTLQQGDVSVKLAGLTLPAPEQMCRLLNGQQEPCANRMATQLELLTRHRQLTCRHRALSTADMIKGVVPEATCRIGEHDLTTRMEASATWKMLAEKPVQQVAEDNAQSSSEAKETEATHVVTPPLRATPLPPMRPKQLAML